MTANRNTLRPRQGVMPKLWRGIASTALSSVMLLGLAGSAAAQNARAAPRISEEQASQAALKALPGRITDISIEKKRGKNVYVVEVIAEKDGAETDVLIDLETGAVIGMDK